MPKVDPFESRRQPEPFKIEGVEHDGDELLVLREGPPLTWGDDLTRLNRIAEEHAVAAHIDEALDTYYSVVGVETPGEERATPTTEPYDQDLEEIPNAVTVLPSHCGLCGYRFEKPAWDAQGSLCPMCGATTKVNR